jgi:hypothetical protein
MVFLTADRNLSYQQDLSAFDVAMVVLVGSLSAARCGGELSFRKQPQEHDHGGPPARVVPGVVSLRFVPAKWSRSSTCMKRYRPPMRCRIIRSVA